MSFKDFLRDEKGVTAMEYGLMVSLISVVMMTSLSILGVTMEGNLQTIITELTKGTAPPP